MSPQSRRRSQSPGGKGRGHRQHGSPAPPPNVLFAEMLRAARELLAVRNPLDAELMVSELLGTWWGMAMEQRPRHGTPGAAGTMSTLGSDDGLEQLIGEGLVEYAARQGSPAALALLSGIACLGTPRQAARAEQAALVLMERGVARPGWAEHVGAVAAGDCYLNSDAYGDRDEVVCVFSYAGDEPHALVVVVDYNVGGMVRDGWVTSQVGKLLERGRQASGHPAESTFASLDPPQARRLLETALEVTDAVTDPPVSESFPSYHAFIRARIRTLPPARDGAGRASVPGPPGREGAPARRRPWSRDRRAMIAAEFLASDEAEDLSDRTAASRCADHIIDYGCDKDFGRPLRMSPVKAETFLLDWLPRKVMLSRAEQEAIPHVLAAWVRWAGRRRGLAEQAIAETLDAVFDIMGTFAQVYRDPTEFGLDAELVDRLLPDGDLEALARRAFAFPLLLGWHGGVNLSSLDPADRADRRTLLAADHDAGAGRPAADRHIDRHLALADRLWLGDPPELWDAAQRLLDAGQDRHAVLHTLMDVIEAAGEDSRDIAAMLRDLPSEENR